ncbi:50S ribosome-binding GTPase [Variovorax sp. J22R24]|uniref:GTPase n=1 Tax=Variovorax gracilis TaxID=3053502 RepID=UPI0025791576|nr:GTPase [Variovorax sp. J22R24]MDM0106602.1 50S ribosome-binding GTPase [Variovorax sp. J22R24]
MNEATRMNPFHDRREAELAVLSALPERAHDLTRLRILADKKRPPVVAVIGKYNHGKSRLLNELIGHAAFSVADKRETVALSAHEHGGVQWLDAPGLDADVETEDDAHALQATWLESDIRLFVHAAKEGELDASERSLLASLSSDDQRTRRQTLFVLSQVDQLAHDQHYRQVVQTIEAQLPALEMHTISATRHRHGIEHSKNLMRVRSGIPGLQESLERAAARVPHARSFETAFLVGNIRDELQQLKAARLALASSLRLGQARQRERFDQDLAATLQKVAGDIQAVLEVPGPDHSLAPDSFANQFKVTPGKLERNRLQVAYSKACIEINAILIKHGVTELPLTQRTAVRSLNSIMIAVLGVYVKYRKDLQQIFCEVAGRERMEKEFARYFEMSADRVELSASIAAAERDLCVAERALEALLGLEDPKMFEKTV